MKSPQQWRDEAERALPLAPALSEAIVLAIQADALRHACELIRRELRGIDATELDDPEGWWETTEGAAFGARKLAVIQVLLSPVDNGALPGSSSKRSVPP